MKIEDKKRTCSIVALAHKQSPSMRHSTHRRLLAYVDRICPLLWQQLVQRHNVLLLKRERIASIQIRIPPGIDISMPLYICMAEMRFCFIFESVFHRVMQHLDFHLCSKTIIGRNANKFSSLIKKKNGSMHLHIKRTYRVWLFKLFIRGLVPPPPAVMMPLSGFKIHTASTIQRFTENRACVIASIKKKKLKYGRVGALLCLLPCLFNYLNSVDAG